MKFFNLIGAVALATTISDIAELHINPRSKTNIYNEQVGTITENIGTINFNTKKYGATIETKARTIVRATARSIYIEGIIDNNKINENAILDYQGIRIYMELPMYQFLSNIEYEFQYLPDVLTEEQQDFLNGKNYTDYYDVLELELYENGTTFKLSQNASTWENTASFDFDTNTDNVDYHRYIYIYSIVHYTTDLQRDDWPKLYNNMNIISDIQTTNNFTIEVPDNTYEVIDLPGLMFTILGMPFAWFSTAFNLTIFPGTPYAIDIGSLILSLIAGLIAIIVIKIIIKL